MGVNLVPRQLLDHALRLVETQKLRDAHAHERRHLGVLELAVDFADRSAELFEFGDEVVEGLAAGEAAARADDAVEHGAELLGELVDFGEGLFEDGGELQEAEGVAGGRGVEDDDLVGEGFDLLEHFGEGHGLVDARDLERGRAVD